MSERESGSESRNDAESGIVARLEYLYHKRSESEGANDTEPRKVQRVEHSMSDARSEDEEDDAQVPDISEELNADEEDAVAPVEEIEPAEKLRSKPRASTLQLVVMPPKHDARYYPAEIRKSLLLQAKGIEQDGLFATRDIRRGEIVAEYTGPLVYKKDKEDTKGKMNDYVGFTGVPLDVLMDGRTTEYVKETGEVVRVLARYANTSNNLGVPRNARMVYEYANIKIGVRVVNGKEKPVYDRIREQVRVLLEAIRDIPRGNEILTGYGAGYTL